MPEIGDEHQVEVVEIGEDVAADTGERQLLGLEAATCLQIVVKRILTLERAEASTGEDGVIGKRRHPLERRGRQHTRDDIELGLAEDVERATLVHRVGEHLPRR